jgi:tRNA(fMet)-specific endonuclease VapC
MLTIIERGEGEEYERLAQRLDAAEGESVCATIISFEEQARGWLAQIARSRDVEREIASYHRLQLLLKFYQRFPVLDYDAPAAAECQELKGQRLRVGTMDLKIAAIALAHNALLVSRNLQDFRRVPGVRVEDWIAATA